MINNQPQAQNMQSTPTSASNLPNIRSVTQNPVGNSLEQGMPSNVVFVNSQRQMPGGREQVAAQQQQSTSSQLLYRQQYIMQPSLMQCHIQQRQQQQQNLLQSARIQTSQHAVMWPSVMPSTSLSNIQQNHQGSVQQGTQPMNVYQQQRWATAPMQQQMMSQMQSQNGQLQHLQQKLNPIQQRLQNSGELIQHQNVNEQQKQLFQSQRAIPEGSSTSLDYTAQTGNGNGGDWQEEVYQKIKAMKEMYFTELNELYSKIVEKLQQHESLSQQTKNEKLEKLKLFKVMLERILRYLRLNKNDIQIEHKDKFSFVQMHIVNIFNSHRPRKTLSLQQGQHPQPHMQQQPQPLAQSQISQMQQKNLSVMQHNSLSSVPTVSNSQQMLQSQQLKQQMQQRQMQHQFLQRQQMPAQLPGHHMYPLHQMMDSSDVEMRQQMGVKPGVFQQHHSTAHATFQHEQLKPLPPFSMTSPQVLQAASPQVFQHHSPQIDQQNLLSSTTKTGTPLQSANSPSVPSTPSPMPGESEKVNYGISSLSNVGNIGHHQTTAVFVHAQSLAIDQQNLLSSMTKTGTPLKSANSPSVTAMSSPSTPLEPSPMTGESEKVNYGISSLSNVGNIGHHQTSAVSVHAQSLAIDQQNLLSSMTKTGTPLQSANSPSVTVMPSSSNPLAPSPMPGESEKVNYGISSLSNVGNIGHHQTTAVSVPEPSQSLAIGTPGISVSPVDQPFERLIKAVKSVSREALIAAVSDISSVVSMVDRVDGKKRMRSSTSAIPSNVVPSFDSVNESGKLLNGSDVSEMESTAASSIKRPRINETNHSLLEEIHEINRQLIDSVVDVCDEDVDPTTAAEVGEGTIVKCSFSAVALSPNLKSQYAFAQMSPIQPLRLLIPTNYPNCSPLLLDKFPVEVSKEYEDLSIKAMSRFKISLRSLSQPMSLEEMAKTWDMCARAVISECGGGTFSSKYGTWENCLSAA